MIERALVRPLIAAALIAVIIAGTLACTPAFDVPVPTEPPRGAVIASSENRGQLPTQPPFLSPTPSPTTALAAVIVTIAPIATRTPGPANTLTPTLMPAYTSTPRPTPTRMRGTFPNIPTPTRVRPPTRTPLPRGVADSGVPPFPTELLDPPFDPNEPNDTPAQATFLDPLPIEAAIDDAEDVDVYEVDVDVANSTLVISVSGEQANRYKVDVVAPRGESVGRLRLDGTIALRATAFVGADIGTYRVYVRGQGSEAPTAPYFISADYSGATATPTRAR